MTAAAILLFINTWGPTAVRTLPLLIKLYEDIKAGKGDQPVTAESRVEIERLAALTSDDIYKSAGVTAPPALGKVRS